MKEYFLRAAEIIEEKGWCQHAYVGMFGEVCLSEAFKRATAELNPSSTFQFVSELTKVEMEFARHINSASGSTPRWNDQPGRTKENVLAKLREVAELV